MKKAHCILLEISPESILWAQQHYPEFLNPALGPKKKITYLLSRALLLHTLQSYYEPTLKQLPEITHNKHLKPIFKDQDISFNITHSSDFIALIMANDNVPVGIDIESIKPRKNFTGLLNRSFSDNETKWILQSSSSFVPTTKNHPLNQEEMVRFFLLWSAKEAYLKADGRGFQGLDSLVLTPEKKIMQGDLHNGIMLLTTLPLHADQIHSSFAIYLPNSFSEHLSIQKLSCNLSQASIQEFNVDWSLIFTES